jgi:hypothetical protein
MEALLNIMLWYQVEVKGEGVLENIMEAVICIVYNTPLL